MKMDETEQRICDVIEQHAAQLYDFAQDIYTHAERGYEEYRTAEKVTAWLQEQCGLSVQTGLAHTGVKAALGSAAPSVCLIGELDGIRSPEHPLAAADGMSHSCGHHMQLTALAGAALALSAVSDQLDGRAVFFAVPSEEHAAMDRLQQLQRDGIAQYCGGKLQLLMDGAFDDIDMCITNHAHMVQCDKDFLLGNNSSSGFLSKLIHIKGKASHAAIAPEKGVNALDVVTLARSAIGMLRSTFRDEDCIRVGEVVRMSSTAINVVPNSVTVDLQLRAKTWEALLEADKKIDRAYRAAAYAFGAEVSITDGQGYLPVIPTAPCDALLQAAQYLPDSFEVMNPMVHNAASTDVGDLTHRMPVINFTYGWFSGTLHGADFRITDTHKAYTQPAKLAALTMYRLLRDHAAQAKQMLTDFHPAMTEAQYRSYAADFDRGFIGEVSPF